MKKSEIEKRYEKLLLDVQTKEHYTRVDLTNKLQSYWCNRGHLTSMRVIDAGVTPMYYTCEICQGPAGSTHLTSSDEPTQEWYRPSLKQLLKMSTRDWHDGLVDHVLSGGLLLRKIVK